jgi:hypothetical protein
MFVGFSNKVPKFLGIKLAILLQEYRNKNPKFR